MQEFFQVGETLLVCRTEKMRERARKNSFVDGLVSLGGMIDIDMIF